ncbi:MULTISPECIES: glycogen debranching protein GlgX [Cetobacterium]|jgi:glycogen operon protein|uniref:Glycogen debranching protein GlgX n=1 Tax=Candidatus Cetobacterium colombiensis TaxID=3073100 RepID=A0ABU4WD34_9FUSO|nr:glycogen debranching protein GlgX [Candidatus Cetobacterium colombiensis]MDX8337440.1 glycogen debranching protein GlgX [Candidatus Cetobacterium colombiensis]
MEQFKVTPGFYLKGTTVLKSYGVNFGVFSRNATKVTLEIFENVEDTNPIFSYDLHPVKNRTGDTWHVFVHGAEAGHYYGWRMDGPYNPSKGHRFDYNKLLLDPYAKCITPKYLSPEIERKSVIINPLNLMHLGGAEEDLKPKKPFKDTIIYEMHIKLFTMNENSGVKHRGKYSGLIEKLDHLKELGITAIELLPIFAFDADDVDGVDPYTGKSLTNVWGYNPIGFFAPTSQYMTGDRKVGAVLGEHLFEFRELVSVIHKSGMEVILDVVYNHTGEGNENGPVVSLKGLDNSIYYVLSPENKRYYCNYSGTGNTLNSAHAVVKELIIDSLRYWYGIMNVDGFRFDLAAILGRDSNGKWIGDLSLLKDIADDSVLSGAKLIAEGWDAAGGYFLGEFPCGWAEWNGKFRDTVRKFVKGDAGQIEDLSQCIMGSPDIFKKEGRSPYVSINFITCHDGFTMWDLVSYNEKHNFANGEENRDGESHNNSWNCGIEGETDNQEIISLRKKQMKNFITILMISQGVPMILMGDEMAKTQNGNNNAYCQDNETNWLDWDRKEEFKDIFEFMKEMIAFRKKHNILKRTCFFSNKDFDGNGFTDISWHGVNLNKPDWSLHSRSLAFMIDGGDCECNQSKIKSNALYAALNAYQEDLVFELPYIPGKRWYRVVDTSDTSNSFLKEPLLIKENSYKVGARSCIVLISK